MKRRVKVLFSLLTVVMDGMMAYAAFFLAYLARLRIAYPLAVELYHRPGSRAGLQACASLLADAWRLLLVGVGTGTTPQHATSLGVLATIHAHDAELAALLDLLQSVRQRPELLVVEARPAFAPLLQACVDRWLAHAAEAVHRVLVFCQRSSEFSPLVVSSDQPLRLLHRPWAGSCAQGWQRGSDPPAGGFQRPESGTIQVGTVCSHETAGSAEELTDAVQWCSRSSFLRDWCLSRPEGRGGVQASVRRTPSHNT